VELVGEFDIALNDYSRLERQENIAFRSVVRLELDSAFGIRQLSVQRAQ
jgi:hypothetical protein